jgi:S-adenosylmethionine hydrolase
MKGVITQIAPQARIIDLSHEIPPGDIRRGALVLWQSIPYFPENSIFLVVIDPGVGTDRRAVIVQQAQRTFIAPDNGVLSFVLGNQAQARALSNPDFALPDPGTTFHGRDIFAPAAAFAALGTAITAFGPAMPNLIKLPAPKLNIKTPGIIEGQILHADHFGNLITSLGKFERRGNTLQFHSWAGKKGTLFLDPTNIELDLPNGQTLPWAKTFGDIAEGACAVILGSSGLLEIVSNRQSAANLLNLQPDQTVTLRFKPITEK